MVNAVSKRFDPAEHLTKQGWKGKGTALKNGHLTRPLAVVQKKTLSGVGKDRDEAVPFWDQIFASTAASLSLPSTPLSSSPSGSPGPSTLMPKLADPRQNKSSSWQTSGSSPSASNSRGQSGLSVNVRISRESARRGLYSRFLRGKVEVILDGEEENEKEVEREVMRSGGSIPAIAGPSSGGDIANTTINGETKEERRVRRAEKAIRKEEKEVRRQERKKRRARKVDQGESAESPAPDYESAPVSATVKGLEEQIDAAKVKKRKRDKSSNVDKSQAGTDIVEAGEARKKDKKREKRRKGEETNTT